MAHAEPRKSVITAIRTSACIQAGLEANHSLGEVDLATDELTFSAHWLDRLGIRTALDDFGAGYSSLTYLQQLPIHTLKIDQSFVNRMTTEESTRIIIESIIALAHKLGIKVVAEGIETHDQEILLKEFNCDIIQGYHISHPLPPKELTAWLQAPQHDK